MATIEDLQIKFSADIKDLSGKIGQVSSQFEKMERTVGRTTSKISGQIGSLGKAFTIGAIVAGAKAFGDYQTSLDKLGSELIDMSGRANVGVEALQRLRFAADQNGASSDGMNIALTKLNKAMGEARGGSIELQRVFKALGLDALVKSGASTDVVLSGIADAFKQIQDPALKAAIAAKLMGKSADELVPLLSQGSQGLRDMTAAMPPAAVVSDELAHKLDNMADATDAFWLKTRGLASWLEGGFIDAFTATMNVVGDAIAVMDGGLAKIAGSSLPGGNVKQDPSANNGAARHKISYTPTVPKIDQKATSDIFGDGAAKAEEARKKAIEATKKYNEVVAELTNKIESLSMSEEAAAYNEELFSNLKKAGVELDSKRGAEIALLTAKLDDEVKAKEAIAEADARAAEAGQKWIDMRQAAGDAVASAFERAIVEGENLRSVFAGLLQDLARMIFQKMVFEQISNAISGAGGLGSIIGGFASGGGINAGNAYMVGERGPEVFVPKVPGTIVPNRGPTGSGDLVISSVINAAPGVNKEDLQGMLDERDRALARRIPRIMIDKQRRNALAGAFS